MRRVVHKFLSAAPTTGLGVMGIYFGANPTKFSPAWDGFALQMQERPTFWAAIGIVILYAVLWWLTSLEPTSRREKLKNGLRPFYAETATILSKLRHLEGDEEFRAALVETDTHQQGVVDWLEVNMGQAAVRKFLTVNRPSHSYVWDGIHDQTLANRRDQYLDALHGRIENLDCLLESDSWDGPQLSFWQRSMKAIRRG